MKKDLNSAIAIYEAGDKKIEVSLNEESIWLSLNRMAELFDVKKAAASKHIKNIYNSGELQQKATVSKMETVQTEGIRRVKRKIVYYNLDMIISVGYRVNSKKATQFRIWATDVLKNYLVKGYAVNEKAITREKFKELQETVAFIKSSIRTAELSSSEVKGILEIIERYADTWRWIEEYDSGKIEASVTDRKIKRIAYDEANEAIGHLKNFLLSRKEASNIFGIKRDRGLFESALNTIYQTFDGKELYPSFEEKASNLLYLIIKNHPFVDGNKRIGALLFLIFLYENLEIEELLRRFNNNTLTALSYLVATSPPQQKEIMINLITQMIDKEEL